jgi:hypothetical protein
MRDIVSQINNENDFNSYVTSFSHQVSAPKEIKYEKHPVRLASGMSFAYFIDSGYAAKAAPGPAAA